MGVLSTLYGLLPADLRQRDAERAYERRKPRPRRDARLYVAQGDNMWGNAITYRRDEIRERRDLLGRYAGLEIPIQGHMSPRPESGDELLVRMASGHWAFFVIDDVRRFGDPPDLFFANARGPVRYAAEHEIPQTKSAAEFLRRRPTPPVPASAEVDAEAERRATPPALDALESASPAAEPRVKPEAGPSLDA